MLVSGRTVWEDSAAEASVSRIILATCSVAIPEGFAIHGNSIQQSKRCQKLLSAMQTLEPVGRVLFAYHCVAVPGNAVREDRPTKTYISRIGFAD